MISADAADRAREVGRAPGRGRRRRACSLMRVKYGVAIETVMTECGSMKMSQA